MNPLSSLTLNWRLMRWSLNEIRHGQLWPISIALTLIIACVFALTALAQRMEQVVVKQGKEALTADSVFVSANPIPTTLLQMTEQRGLATSQMTRFTTMAFSEHAMQLVTVKAVDSQYPLRGSLILSDGQRTLQHVSINELWLDERLFSQLEVEVGDAMSVGDADFIVTGKIMTQPGLSFNPFQQMPTVLIHQTDIEKTGAIQLGSRVQYRLFINATEHERLALQDTVELTPSDEWRETATANRTNEVFERTQQYLSLTLALVIIMAAATLVLTCQHYVASRQRTIAMLKSLGANKKWIARWLTIQVLLLFAMAAVAGSVIGVILEYALRIPLAGLLPDPLPAYGTRPILVALFSSGLIAVPALGIPLGNLLNIRAISVMQSTRTSPRLLWNSALLLAPVLSMIVVYWHNSLVWMVIAGILGLFVILALVSLAITRALHRLPLTTSMRLALSRMSRSSLVTGLQFGALSLSLMLLAVMWLVRTDLLADWQRILPENAPNAFAINIAGYEKAAYLAELDNAGIERSTAFPIIRGRLTEINGQPAQMRVENGEGPNALRRELNLTWSEALPSYNPIVAGQWNHKSGVSVEQALANELGIHLGDRLTFLISSQPVEAVVNSIRAVEWREMKPNFFFIFTPDVMANFSGSWMVSFRINADHQSVLTVLSRQFPTVTLMDIRQMGEKIQILLTQIVWAMTILAALGMLAGLLLIFTLLRLSLSQRQQELQLYRTLGASRRRVNSTIWAEFGVMALVAGLIASMSAEAVVAGIMHWGFSLPPQMHWEMWLLLPLLTCFTLALVVGSLLNKLLTPINKAFD
ncbi:MULTISPECIES: FtsX-like permease family protein [unclassified Vibrio]|nr:MULTISPECIES: FtsX-like permease family protein [unclassified Vibrio]NNN43799.1 FtsX-like permease family protein [Vibrio sp. 1-1(7)]NNN71623.1 FtsX-like permease family protein [Vibrio sp. 12-2(3-a)]